MTRQALRVIKSSTALQLVVRIVTGNTTCAVIALVSGAVEYSVRLKTDIVKPSLPRHRHHLIEAAMTRATELLRQFVRIHLSGIKNLQSFELISFDRREVFLAWTMTGFTCDARHQATQLQLRTSHGVRRVTCKTSLRFSRTERMAESIFESSWC